MPGLLILITLLRKFVKTIIAIVLVSNPLMAADHFTLKNNDLLLSYQDNESCCNNIRIGSKDNKKMPDMFEKPDRISQRERADPWSTYDFDHGNSGLGLGLSINM